ncbi:MAG: hypothetical protein F4Y01_03400 [Gammaproteobacteria bacterium]|nr:hypothetical protein [Gammaproteobacteria bacterium]
MEEYVSAATEAGRVVFEAKLHPTARAGRPIVLDRFLLIESQLEGWMGYAKVAPGGRSGFPERTGIADAFSAVVRQQCSPGQGAMLVLSLVLLEQGIAKTHPLRFWPSVITKVTSTADRDGRTFLHLHFSDPVTYYSRRPIWGAFRDCSLGAAVGGAVSLAMDGSGAPTTTPQSGGDLPPVHIAEHVREAVGRMPYVVASGEPLGVWLGRLLGRLGVRMEMMGNADGEVKAALRDGPPAGAPVGLSLGEGPATATNAILRGTRLTPRGTDRDAVLDNPSTGETLRVGDGGAVGTVVTSAGTDIEETAFRAGLAREFQNVAMVQTSVVSGQCGIVPGRRLEFDRPISGARAWQAGLTEHLFNDGAYFNTAYLIKDGAAWRPRVSREPNGATLVTGIVNDGSSSAGAAVARDRLGRIPVSLNVDVAAPVGDDAPDDASLSGAPRLMLPIAGPIAGGSHGFLSDHRQGDRCRIAVNGPLDLEVVGFLYDDHRHLDDTVSDGSMGIVVDHEPGQWSGILFRPDDEDNKDATALAQDGVQQGSENPGNDDAADG